MVWIIKNLNYDKINKDINNKIYINKIYDKYMDNFRKIVFLDNLIINFGKWK